MAFERIKRLAGRFSSPTDTEKIASLQERVATLSTQRDKIYKDISSLEQRESELVEQGKANKSIVRRRLASQVAQIRRELQRQYTTAAMINGQVDILGTDIHNLTLLQQGAMANLNDSQEITKNAVRAEEILESLSSDVALVSVLESGVEMSQEELDILAEFEEPEPTEPEVVVKPEPQTEPEQEPLPKERVRKDEGAWEDEGCCSCHISPPCGYCTDHSDCEECGELTLSDDMIEVKGILGPHWVCEECAIKTSEKPVATRRVITREAQESSL